MPNWLNPCCVYEVVGSFPDCNVWFTSVFFSEISLDHHLPSFWCSVERLSTYGEMQSTMKSIILTFNNLLINYIMARKKDNWLPTLLPQAPSLTMCLQHRVSTLCCSTPLLPGTMPSIGSFQTIVMLTRPKYFSIQVMMLFSPTFPHVHILQDVSIFHLFDDRITNIIIYNI